jgi:hypothetical protein
MASTDSLHELVHSLDTNEKRYYRMYCSRHAIGGENEYAVLFDLILGQTEYDEESLRQQMLQMGSRQGRGGGHHPCHGKGTTAESDAAEFGGR